MASKVQVIDEFLPPPHWENLLNNMGLNGKSNNFPWFYMPYVTYNDTHYMELEKESAGQFTHLFWDPNQGSTDTFQIIQPALQMLEVYSIIRIKANMQLRTGTTQQNALHRDTGDFPIDCTTMILYMNTNNGYTHFEDGTKVESVANRICFFPNHMLHGSATCTDEKFRSVINFNLHCKDPESWH